MKKATTTATANSIEVIASGLIRPHVFKKLDNAIRYAELAKRKFPNCDDVIISVNGIMMPPSVEDDETFFYASTEAAKSGKVWLESVHGFVTQSFKSEFESGCFDWEEGEYEALVSDNIYKDIWDYEPVTGEAGENSAIVRDKDVADLCEKIGYSVLHCGTGHVLEDGTSDEWWVIIPGDGSHDEDDEVPETILDIIGEVDLIKPIAKSIYRAWDRGVIDFNGFCDSPRFNPDREYRLTVIKDRDGYISLYVKPTEDEVVVEVAGTGAEIAPIAKSFHKACKKGLVNYKGYPGCPNLLGHQTYKLRVYKDSKGRHELDVTPLIDSTHLFGYCGISSIYDEATGTAVFYRPNGDKTFPVTLSLDRWNNEFHHMESNLPSYFFEKYKDKGCLFRMMEESIPGTTGFEYLESNGDWVKESVFDERLGTLERFDGWRD